MTSADFEGILKKYEAIVRKTVKWLVRKMPGWISRDDMAADGILGLWKAYLNYDPRKGTFQSYARRRILGEILDGLRTRSKWKRKRKPLFFPIDPESEKLGMEHRFTRLEMEDALELLKTLPKRSQEMVYGKFALGKTYQTIGRENGVCEARACQIVKEAIRELQRRMKVVPA